MKNQAWQVESFGENAKWQEVAIDKPKQGQVLIQNHYSSINYKDALGFTSRGKIFRSFPMVGGIDLAGEVVESKSEEFKIGDQVIVTGTGLGENYPGGYAAYTLVDAENIVALPKGISTRQAMIIGTAGFTAALAIHRMQSLGQANDLPILVSGASGGVGSFATLLLSKGAYTVHALSGKSQAHEYLEALGASKVVNLEDLNLGDKPLDKIRYSGCIDNVGGDFLAKILPYIDLYGNLASIGLAGGHKFQTNVMPFILRGVSIIGISSNNAPMNMRKEIWHSLANHLDEKDFARLKVEEIPLQDIDQHMQRYFQRKVMGRLLVKIK
tara:strand:- start:5821 stop:6798 length:978 start_codon:yes stop_codon:yes gene_type:complete